MTLVCLSFQHNTFHATTLVAALHLFNPAIIYYNIIIICIIITIKNTLTIDALIINNSAGALCKVRCSETLITEVSRNYIKTVNIRAPFDLLEIQIPNIFLCETLYVIVILSAVIIFKIKVEIVIFSKIKSARNLHNQTHNNLIFFHTL